VAVCPSCGRSKLLLRSIVCVTCGKQGCERCLQTFGSLQRAPGTDTIAQYVCSDGCFERWMTRALEQGVTPTLWGPRWSVQGTVLEDRFSPRAHEMAERHRVNLRLQYAERLLEAERTEDAAEVYESLGRWKEAGEVRRKAKQGVVTQVQVDVNELIDQVRKGGLTTTYTCPACQSPIRIDANVDPRALNRCQYCGTAVQSTDLVDFLSRVVGYR
jgi:hypothetical protein